MLETLIVGGIITLLAVLIGVWIALKIQQRHLLHIQTQQEAWERAQEGHLRIWEVRQEKHTSEIEQKLTGQVLDIRHDWRKWEAKDAQRVQAWEQRYETAATRLSLEHELARLPRVEETPLPAHSNDLRQHIFAHWQPPRLHGANLSQHDLSYRYLGRADLREAQLAGTNFYMADLSGATLAGADLSGADLSGANLSGTDLRNATFTNANLLVADLHNAVLIGANLRGARNLTPQQVCSAIYDSSTQFDIEVDITLTRTPSVQSLPVPSAFPAPTASSPTEENTSTQSSEASASSEEQDEPGNDTDTSVSVIEAEIPAPIIVPNLVNPAEILPTERAKSKAQSLRPPVLLPLSEDESEVDLMVTNLPTNGHVK